MGLPSVTRLSHGRTRRPRPPDRFRRRRARDSSRDRQGRAAVTRKSPDSQRKRAVRVTVTEEKRKSRNAPARGRARGHKHGVPKCGKTADRGKNKKRGRKWCGRIIFCNFAHEYILLILAHEWLLYAFSPASRRLRAGSRSGLCRGYEMTEGGKRPVSELMKITLEIISTNQ